MDLDPNISTKSASVGLRNAPQHQKLEGDVAEAALLQYSPVDV